MYKYNTLSMVDTVYYFFFPLRRPKHKHVRVPTAPIYEKKEITRYEKKINKIKIGRYIDKAYTTANIVYEKNICSIAVAGLC